MSNLILMNKKKALLARKEKILEEIQYYQKRITEFHANRSKDSHFDHDSSDSDTDIPLFIDNTPSISQLKLQQAALKTSLQATQELTSLQVLQSEVTVLSEVPSLENGPPVLQEGLWHEVALECRVDLVPFAITFLMHKADGKFGARSYRDIRVVPVKAAHESELSKSVLTHVTTPSDALEVLKSYAAAHRSRRTTLARLAEKYAGVLFLEPMTDGGYLLKCAELLEVFWTLENKWSPIAAFHHRMKFDLEYMDESYIKTITQLHRQLSDPSLETDERTLLLSRIISTCLEAKGPTQELYENMESDPESAQMLRKRRTTLDQELDVPAMKRKKDNEVMAPPKSLPKKSKPKGKENNDLKRPSADDGATAKKMKLADVSKSPNEESNVQNERKSAAVKGNKKIMTEVTNTQNADTSKGKKGTNAEEDQNNVEPKNKPSNENKNSKSSKKTAPQNIDITKNNDGNALQTRASKSTDKIEKKNSKTSTKDNVQNIDTTKKDDCNALQACASKSMKNNVDEQKNSKSSKNSNVQIAASSKNDDDLPKKSNISKNTEKASQARASKSGVNNVNELDNKKTNKGSAQKDIANAKKNEGRSQPPSKTSIELKNRKVSKINVVPKNVVTTKKNENNATQARVTKSTNSNVVKNKNVINKKTTSKENVNQINEGTNVNPVTNGVKSSEIVKKDSNKQKVDGKIQADAGKDKNVTNKNKIVEQNNKNKDTFQSAATTSETVQNDIQKGVEKNKKTVNKPDVAIEKNAKNIQKATNIAVNKVKTPKISQEKAGKVLQNKLRMIVNNKNQLKSQLNGNEKISKIPQKKTSLTGNVLKNPLRISPRKLPLKMKNSLDSMKKTMQKPLTSIPRLLKKQMPKT